MDKDWRLAVCTRWRPLISLLIAIFAVFAFSIITSLIDKHLLNELNRKRDALEIGMTKEELFNIMGEPVFSNTRNVADLRRFGFPSEDIPDEIRKQHRCLVEYAFISKKMPWSKSAYFISGIYLDEDRKVIVMLDTAYMGWMDFFGIQQDLQSLALIGVLAIVVVSPIVIYRLWCKKKLEKHTTQPRRQHCP